MEGERLTSELFRRHAEASFDLQAEQLRRADAFALISPVIALRRLSMAVAGTDLQGYRRFLEQAEQHRYRIDRKSTRLNSSHQIISYAVFCLKKKKNYDVALHVARRASARYAVPRQARR